MNNHINPILYKIYLPLHKKLGAHIVHRRRRKSADYIEIVFLSPTVDSLEGHLNTLKQAEKDGFWVICRAQRGKHAFYRGRQVFQLFLSPVHPKKQRAQQFQTISNDIKQHQTTWEDISFDPIPLRRLKSFARRRQAFSRVFLGSMTPLLE